MKNGIRLSNLKIISTFILIIFLSSSVLADEVLISPLIKLDEISPSFEDPDQENIPQRNRSEIMNDAKDNKINLKTVALSILNKVTARVDDVKIPIKENYIYEDLRIYPIHCSVSDPSQKSETSVYLKIYNDEDSKIDVASRMIFSGWMLKTLPSISSMEHPLYDIWVNDCS